MFGLTSEIRVNNMNKVQKTLKWSSLMVVELSPSTFTLGVEVLLHNEPFQIDAANGWLDKWEFSEPLLLGRNFNTRD